MKRISPIFVIGIIAFCLIGIYASSQWVDIWFNGVEVEGTIVEADRGRNNTLRIEYKIKGDSFSEVVNAPSGFRVCFSKTNPCIGKRVLILVSSRNPDNISPIRLLE